MSTSSEESSTGRRPIRAEHSGQKSMSNGIHIAQEALRKRILNGVLNYIKVYATKDCFPQIISLYYSLIQRTYKGLIRDCIPTGFTFPLLSM